MQRPPYWQTAQAPSMGDLRAHRNTFQHLLHRFPPSIALVISAPSFSFSIAFLSVAILISAHVRCRLNDSKRLALQDGSASESTAQLRVNPRTNLFSCEFHIKSELGKRGPTGHADAKLYDKLISLPKGHAHLAETYYAQLSPNSLLRNRPKEQLSPAFLPPGVCTHGVTTSNMAEVSHRTFDGEYSTAPITILLRLIYPRCSPHIALQRCVTKSLCFVP